MEMAIFASTDAKVESASRNQASLLWLGAASTGQCLDVRS